MAVAGDLAAYLQAAGCGILASTIFLYGLPADAPLISMQDACMALIPVPGLPPLHILNDVAPSIERPMVQVLIRGLPYGFADAETRAYAAWVALASVHNTILSGTFYLGVMVMQSPFYLKQDSLGRPILAFNVRCEKAC